MKRQPGSAEDIGEAFRVAPELLEALTKMDPYGFIPCPQCDYATDSPVVLHEHWETKHQGEKIDAIHQTVPIQVWADIDVEIAGLVRYLNTIPGVRTHSSCQGQRSGPAPFGPYVMCSWTPEALDRLTREFGDHLTLAGNGAWGYIHPEDTAWELNDEEKRVT